MISADKDVDNGTVVQRNVFVNIQQQTCVQTLLAAAAAMRVLHISRRRITALYSCSSEWSNMRCGRPPQYAPPPPSWPLTFWPWKWCPSHVRYGLPLCQFWSSYRPLYSRLRPDVRDRQTSDRCQTRIIA